MRYFIFVEYIIPMRKLHVKDKMENLSRMLDLGAGGPAKMAG